MDKDLAIIIVLILIPLLIISGIYQFYLKPEYLYNIPCIEEVVLKVGKEYHLPLNAPIRRVYVIYLGHSNDTLLITTIFRYSGGMFGGGGKEVFHNTFSLNFCLNPEELICDKIYCETLAFNNQSITLRLTYGYKDITFVYFGLIIFFFLIASLPWLFAIILLSYYINK